MFLRAVPGFDVSMTDALPGNNAVALRLPSQPLTGAGHTPDRPLRLLRRNAHRALGRPTDAAAAVAHDDVGWSALMAARGRRATMHVVAASRSTLLASRLPSGLLDPGAFPNFPDRVELRETHISWVFLAGERAYKVKKPVVLPFVDYGTLRAPARVLRRGGAAQPRVAPERLPRVVALVPRGPAGLAVAPEHDPRAVEYAVEMRRYDEGATLAATARGGPRGERGRRRDRGSSPDSTPAWRRRTAQTGRSGWPMWSTRRFRRLRAPPPEPSRRPAWPRWRGSRGQPSPVSVRVWSARGRRAGSRRPWRPAGGTHPPHRAAGGGGCRRVRPIAARRRHRL